MAPCMNRSGQHPHPGSNEEAEHEQLLGDSKKASNTAAPAPKVGEKRVHWELDSPTPERSEADEEIEEIEEIARPDSRSERQRTEDRPYHSSGPTSPASESPRTRSVSRSGSTIENADDSGTERPNEASVGEHLQALWLHRHMTVTD